MKTQAIKKCRTVLGFLLALVAFGIVPLFVSSPYYLDLFIMLMVNAVLAMMFIMTLRTGLINMGMIAFFGIGAYASALLSINLGLSVWLCIPLAALITGIIACAIGFVLIGGGSGGLSFVALSAVLGMLFTVVVGSLSVFGGWTGIRNIPAPESIGIPALGTIRFDSKVPFYYLGLVLFLVVIIVSNALYSSSVGKAWRAIGMGPRLAESLGVDLFRYKMASFVVSAALCGLIGSFYAHYEGFIFPDSFGMWQSIGVQVNAILGGIGFAILGPIVGAGVMTFLPEFIRGLGHVAPLFNGVLLIVLILFLPDGLLGLRHYRTNLTKLAKTVSSVASRKDAG